MQMTIDDMFFYDLSVMKDSGWIVNLTDDQAKELLEKYKVYWETLSVDCDESFGWDSNIVRLCHKKGYLTQSGIDSNEYDLNQDYYDDEDEDDENEEDDEEEND